MTADPRVYVPFVLLICWALMIRVITVLLSVLVKSGPDTACGGDVTDARGVPCGQATKERSPILARIGLPLEDLAGSFRCNIPARDQTAKD